MFFKNLCVLVFWTKVASALEGLKKISSTSTRQLSLKSALSMNGLITIGQGNSYSLYSQQHVRDYYISLYYCHIIPQTLDILVAVFCTWP